MEKMLIRIKTLFTIIPNSNQLYELILINKKITYFKHPLPVRNLWSLEPGECIVADVISDKLKYEVYFPLHDIGLDLLIVGGNKHVGIQVKESRYYTNFVWKSGHIGHSWHQVRKKAFDETLSKVNFYVFVTYVTHFEAKKVTGFDTKFLIVPTDEIKRRIAIKDPGKNLVYSFCFHFEDSAVFDERVTTDTYDERADYTKFHDAWHLIKHALKLWSNEDPRLKS